MSFRGTTMGTSYSVRITHMPSTLDAEQLQLQIEERLAEINHEMSTYETDSVLSLFNQSHDIGWHVTSPELASLVSRSLEIYRITNGAFDVSVGPLVNLWGFGPSPSNQKIPDRQSVQSAKNSVGSEFIKVDLQKNAIWKAFSDMYVDLSAIAKGYAVDEIAKLLESSAIKDFMVEIGGEVRAQGDSPHKGPWRIGIETPEIKRGDVELIIQLQNMSIATSGDYRNFFEYNGKRYSHTIDPATGMPANQDLASVSVLGTNTADVDALATAMMVIGSQKAEQLAEKLGLPIVMILRKNHGFEVIPNEAAKNYIITK